MSETSPTRSSRAVASVAVLAVLAAVFWVGGRAAQSQLEVARIGIDDANIYFRYAKNIASGLGCVWNPGERVEGFSSVLWLGCCTAAWALTAEPESALFIVSVALAAIGAWVVALRLGELFDGSGGPLATLCAGLCVAAFVAASPGHVIWLTATLMDSAIFTAALVIAWTATVAWLRRPASASRQLFAGGAAVALSVARPEGPLAAAVLLGAGWLFAALPERRFGRALRDAVVPAAMFMIANVALVFARHAYFGDWLPNTYYAKVDESLGYRAGKGLDYLLDLLKADPAASVITLAGCIAGAIRARAASVRLALVAILFGAFNVFFVGGDHFASGRIVQPYWTLVLVPIGGALASFSPRASGARTVLAAGAIVVIAAVMLLAGRTDWRALPSTSHFYFQIPEHGRLTATGFNALFPPGERPTVGVIAAGGFPLVYEGRSFDLLGLNDVEMARATRVRRGILHGHGAFHAPTFFGRAPELLIGFMMPAPAANPAPPEHRIPLVALDDEDARRFDRTYAPVAIASDLPGAQGIVLPAWARRDWLAKTGSRFGVRELVPTGTGWAYR